MKCCEGPKYKNAYVVMVASILLVFAAFVMIINYVGKSTRVVSKRYEISGDALPVIVVNRSTELYHLWKSKGYAGRKIVHIGNYLHFVPTNISEINSKVGQEELSGTDIRKAYEAKLSYKNFLLIAMQSGIARSVFNILPRERFIEKYGRGAKIDPKFAPVDDEVSFHYFGSERVVSSRLPEIEEAVLLNIDASFFKNNSEVLEFSKLLKRAGLSIDLITLCMAEDNPEVSEIARDRLRQLKGFF